MLSCTQSSNAPLEAKLYTTHLIHGQTIPFVRLKVRAHWDEPYDFMSLLLEDMHMRHFDLSPLYRSTIGFDRIFSLLDQTTGPEVTTYPPYNIERTDENTYRITVAVAGFAEPDLSIEVKEATLTISGDKKPSTEAPKLEILHQGIAARAFVRRFQLADHVQVTGASLENGLLHVDLVREVPEAKKPRVIPIAANSQAKVLEATAA
jgi:molecular chaperone IbpA